MERSAFHFLKYHTWNQFGGCGRANFGTEQNTITLRIALRDYSSHSPQLDFTEILPSLLFRCFSNCSGLNVRPTTTWPANYIPPARLLSHLDCLHTNFKQSPRNSGLRVPSRNAETVSFRIHCSVTPTSSLNQERIPYQTYSHLCTHPPHCP